MPNWVTNVLEIKGSCEFMDQLIQFVRSEKLEFDFNQVIPYPDEFARLDTERVRGVKGLQLGRVRLVR